MKKYLLNKSHIALKTSIALLTTLLLVPAAAFAANFSTVSLSASPTSVIIGNSTVVTINVSTGSTKTDGGEVKITFDASKLQYVSVDYAGTGFSTDSPNFAVNSGSIVISRYTGTPPGPSGNFSLAKITFKALAQSGTSPVSIDAAASYFSDDGNGGATSTPNFSGPATISFQAAAPATCGAGQTGTPPNCVTPPATCPSGQTGTPPNCKTPTSGATTCPTGQTGTPPNCKTPTTGSTGSTGSTGGTPSTSTPTTTPTPTTTDTTTTTDPTTPTSPEGEPVPAVPVGKKSNMRLYAIAGGTVVVVLAAAGAFMMMRKRSMIGGSGVFGVSNSKAILGQSPTPPPTQGATLNRIPSVETKAPGEVVQPNGPHDPTPPPVVG